MKKLVIVGVVAASLGLSACAAKATIGDAVSSLGSSPDLQIHLTASVAGTGTTQAQQVLSKLSIDLNYSNPTGAALSQSNGKADGEVIVNAGGDQLGDVRVVGGNAYAEVNLNALTNIPSVNVSPSQIAAAQLLFGGRWFEAPSSLLNAYAAKSAQVQASATKDRAVEKKILDDLAGVIDNGPYTTLSGGGYSQTGTLESIVKAVLPTIQSLTGSTTSPGAVKGTYTIEVTTSGSTATGASVSITAPNGSLGDVTVQVTATIAHNSDAVVAPTGATIITPALLKGLTSQAA